MHINTGLLGLIKYQLGEDGFIRYKVISPIYRQIKHLRTGITGMNIPKKNSISFYAQNVERVNAVANMLSDEQSKKTYMGIIKFRQTHRKKDFPRLVDEKMPYFIKELKMSKDEVFVDCGAYTGDTIDDFLKHCPEYEQIIAFEPDPKNFEKLKEKYGENQKITFISAGVYDRDGEISFLANNSMTSMIVEDDKGGNLVKISVKTIDNLNLEKVSFIKMDIEGVELNALKGAEKTILRDKPKLAICIYHSDEDMIRIAEYIRNLIPEYKFYVRQHKRYFYDVDTVLYAL